MKARVDQILDGVRDYLTTHEYVETPILTAYVNVDTTDPDNQRAEPAWGIDLKNETKQLRDGMDPELFKRRNVQEQLAHAEEMILEHLSDRPSGRSVMLLSDLEDFIAIDLPVSLPTRLYFGQPQIKPLLFALDEYQNYLVALMSGDEARLVEVFLSRTTQDATVDTGQEAKRRLSRKSMEAGQDRRSPEFERRYANDIAAELTAYFLENPDDERLVLGGNLRLAHAVKKALHPAMQQAVVAIQPIDFNASENQIVELVKPIAAEAEAAHDLAVVDDLVRLHNSGGAAVLERQGVEKALANGQVRTLALPFTLDDDKYDALIVQAVVNGAEVEFVHGEAAGKLQEYGGIGARLYYAVN